MTTDGNGLHSHTTTATDAAIAALTARVTKLEGVPVPVPAVADLQKAIDATPVGGTLDITGFTFAGSFTVRTITLKGGKIVNPNNSNDPTAIGLTVKGGIIDGTEVAGGWQGIVIDNATGAIVRNCHVHDQMYAGIEAFSMVGGAITGNLVERIGYGVDPLSQPGQGNCYGIALTSITGLVASQCRDVLVEGNTVTDVPPWHGIDTHGGQRITFRKNTVQRCARAMFITTQGTVRPAGIVVDSNTILGSTRVLNGAALVPLTLVSVDGITITGNIITGWAGQSPTNAVPYYDYGSASTGIVVGAGNVVQP